MEFTRIIPVVVLALCITASDFLVPEMQRQKLYTSFACSWACGCDFLVSDMDH